MRKRVVRLMAMGVTASMFFASAGGGIGTFPVVYAEELSGGTEQDASDIVEETAKPDNSDTEMAVDTVSQPEMSADGGKLENTDDAADSDTDRTESVPEEAESDEINDLSEETVPDEVEEKPEETVSDETEEKPEETVPDEVEEKPEETVPDEVEEKPEETAPDEVEEKPEETASDADAEVPETIEEEENPDDLLQVTEPEDFVYRASSDGIIVNMKDLGAGNQDADADTQAFQRALNVIGSEEFVRSAPDDTYADKVKLIIPEGSYYLNADLAVSADTEICAEDGAVIYIEKDELVFAAQDGGTDFMISGGTWKGEDGASLGFEVSGDIEIANMDLDGISMSLEDSEELLVGNSADATGNNVRISGNTIDGGSSGFGIRVQSAYSGVTVENNTVRNVTGSGILVLGKNCTVKGNTISGTKGAGIYVENTSGLTVDGNVISGSSERGILTVNTAGVTVINNQVGTSGNSGIEITSNCTGAVRIEGNTVNGSGKSNLVVAGGTSCTIKGNTMSDGKEAGIYVEGRSGAAIEGNTLNGNAGQGLLVYRSADTRITGNKIIGNKSDGILVHTESPAPKIDNNTVEGNTGDGIKTDNVASPEIVNNKVRANNVGIYICRCENAVIKGNTTEENRDKGIYVEGNLNDQGAFTGYYATIVENTVKADRLSGILVFHARALIHKNTVSDTGAGVGEGIVVQFSGNSIVSENTISGVKRTTDDTGNSIIISDNSDKVMVYKNKISNSGNKGIQVTYTSHNVTVLANDVQGSGYQGITFSRKSDGAIAGNRVRQCGSHGIINEDSNVKTGGNYVSGTGGERIAYNGSSGTIKGNVIVGGRVFVVNSQVEQENNRVVQNETDDNPYMTESNIEDFVKRLYQKVLNRECEQAGLWDWTNRLLVRDESGAQVAHGFFFSDEYKNKNTDENTYLDTLYSAMFDRAADKGGKAGWVKDFATGFSREFIYRGFAESEEFQNLCNRYGIERGMVTLGEPRDQNRGVTEFVSRIYTKALSRKKVDADGLNDWCNRILNGTSPKDVVAGFIFSEEFTNRGLSNEDFVKVMYETYFNRTADEAGFADWMGRLGRGADYQEVVNGFSNSTEFDNLIKSFGL